MKPFSVEFSDNFRKQLKKLLKKHRSLAIEVAALTYLLAEKPLQGTPLGNDCYKIRLAVKSKGKEKSGGARIITCVVLVEERVILLSIYDKSEKETISDSELKAVLKEAGL